MFVRKLRIGMLLSSWPQVQLRGAIRRRYRVVLVITIEYVLTNVCDEGAVPL
jgi:hypothetical protein